MQQPKHQPDRRYVLLDRGRDIGEVVRGSDPETGEIVAHAVNRTQRQIDQLLHAGAIDGAQWGAAGAFYELYAKARAVPDVKALDPCVMGGGGAEHEPDPIAEREYRKIWRKLTPETRRIIQAIVLDDEPPAADQRALEIVRAALEGLAIAMGFA